MSAFRMVLVCAALIVSTAQAHATLIDTTAPFDSAWRPFGEPITQTYGQTFTAPSDNVIDSFSLFLTGAPFVEPTEPFNSETFPFIFPVEFKAYLYAWDGEKATGPALFTSGLQAFLGSPMNSPQEFAFATGGITLTPGAKYVAFLNAVFDGDQSMAFMPNAGPLPSNPYAGGDFVYYNNDTFDLLTTTPWEQPGDPRLGDVWFKASFSPASAAVPEPSSLVLLSLLGGATLLSRTRWSARRGTGAPISR
jgi:hypothetical protein